MSESDRHRADDDIEAISSGSYRTPNGETDLLDGSSASLNSSTSESKQRRSSKSDPPDGPKLNKQARLEARLAKRTSKVMTAYKSYLAQIESEPATPNHDVPKISKRSSDTPDDHNSSFTNIEVGRPPFHKNDYGFQPYKDEEDGKPFPSQQEYKDGLVQRSWTYRRENSRDPPEQRVQSSTQETFLDYDDIRSKFGIEAEDTHARVTPYKYPMLHSRRVKRGLVLIALTAVVIGISTGVASHKKKQALPDWEAELAEIQKEEQEKHAMKQQQVSLESHDGEVMSERPPPSETIEGIEAPVVQDESEVKETAVAAPNSYKEVVKKFNPIAFDRSKGWDGTTYNDAVNFCNELEDRSLCPYEAVCPLGAASKPAGGYKTTGSWLAISDEPNGWVHLGSIDSCTKYEETYSSTPDWGLTGKEETTKNIMCCRITEDSPKVSIIDETSTATQEEPAIVMNADEITPLTDEEKAQVKFVSDKLQPIFYNRSHGWEGQTYSEALEFCASRESRVPCPYTAVCPNGKGRPPLGGVKDNRKGSFVPIIDTPNQWVQLSSKGVCELHSSLYGSPPEWGLTGEHNEEMTRNIVCCKEPEGSFEDTGDDEQDDAEGSTTASEGEVYETKDTSDVNAGSSIATLLTTAEQSVLDVMHPLWFGRKHGYQGTSYDDAVQFCNNVGGMSVCPPEAYCPNGPDVTNRPPLFLDKDAFDGEQWAPTSSHHNSWILVGTADGDASSTCKTHEELHDNKTPSWGEDGSFTHLKENVMCCVTPKTSAESVSETDDSGNSSETSSNTITAANNALDMEQLMQTQLKPLWLGEDEGWTGGSHDDAMAFCKTIRGKQLCPYSAYCPHGAGQPVMGRHKIDFNAEGELYSPVFGNENHWVMIGQKGENSATTCMSHYQLEGSNPSWGLTTDNAELKKYVMCCTMNTSG